MSEDIRNKTLELYKETSSGKLLLRELVNTIGMSEVLAELLRIAQENNWRSTEAYLSIALNMYFKGD